MKLGRAANTDAKALAGFLAAVGVDWSEERLNKVLTLLAVIVIEIGAGVSLSLAMSLQSGARGSAVVVVQSVDAGSMAHTSPTLTPTGQETPATVVAVRARTGATDPALRVSTAQVIDVGPLTTATADISHMSAPPEQPEAPACDTSPPVLAAKGEQGVSVTTATATRERVLALITEAGGSIRASQREIAVAVGCSPANAARVLKELKLAGALTVRSGATGSVLALV